MDTRNMSDDHNGGRRTILINGQRSPTADEIAAITAGYERSLNHRQAEGPCRSPERPARPRSVPHLAGHLA